MSLFRKRRPPVLRIVRRRPGTGALWCARCGAKLSVCGGKFRRAVCQPAARPLAVPRLGDAPAAAG